MPQEVTAKDFVDQFFRLWEEMLGTTGPEVEYRFVLDRNAGWADTLSAVDAEEASRRLIPGGTSIAAQTAHAAYYLELFEATVLNRHVEADWPASFQPAEVDEAAWARERERFSAVAGRVGELMRTNPRWEPEHLGGAMSNLAHLAYHLGSVRQMLRVVKG